MQKKIALVVVFGIVLLLAGAILSLNGTVYAQDGEGEGAPETPPFDHSVFPMLADTAPVEGDITDN